MSRTVPLLVTTLVLGAAAAGCGPGDKSRSAWSATAGVTSATAMTSGAGGGASSAYYAGAPALGATQALVSLTAVPGVLDPNATPATPGTTTPTPGTTTPAPGGGQVGSRFWYENDAFGNPLQAHSGSESTLAADVLAAMNAERQQAGLAPLAASTDGLRAAKAHAEDMRDRPFFDHISPEGWTPDDRLRWTGAASYSGGGENIAAGQPSARSIVDAWMASPAHRANILSTLFTEVGVGIAEGSPTYACAVFIAR